MFLTSQSRAEVIREFSPWYIRSRRIEICQRLISIHLDLSVWTSQMAQVRNRQEQWRQMSFVSIVTHQDYRLVLFTVILWNNSSFFLPFLSLYTLQCPQLIPTRESSLRFIATVQSFFFNRRREGLFFSLSPLPRESC